MRRRLTTLVAMVAVVAALASCGVSGITNTGVVGFGSVPSAASDTQTPVPKGDTKYEVYFQIGDYLEAEPRVTRSGLPADALYHWLLAQIVQGPNAGEIARGFSQPDDALSGIQMLGVDPLGQAAAATLSYPLSGNDLGQIICTLSGENTQIAPVNDAFGIVYPTDPKFINWDNCGAFPLSGGAVVGSVTASPQ